MLSLATVYNTLNLFTTKNLIKPITSVEKETRYDVVTDMHGHFHCNVCNQIFDFSVGLETIQPQTLKDFQIDVRNILFKGICPDCLHHQNTFKE